MNFIVTLRFLYNMKATGSININSIRIQEFESKIDSLLMEIISPPTVSSRMDNIITQSHVQFNRI